MYYHTLNEELRRRFGCKVYKLALDGGFTCPNRDGTIGARGCIFCAGELMQKMRKRLQRPVSISM